MAEARPLISNASYGASHTFVEDWRTHRVWDWLNQTFWLDIPTDKRLLRTQVPYDTPQQEYARQMLSEIRRNARFVPFTDAVDDGVFALTEDALRVSDMLGVLPASAPEGSVRRLHGQQGGVSRSASAQAAESYYRPVLTQLMEAALKLYLQVQTTSETAYLFVPGKHVVMLTFRCGFIDMLMHMQHIASSLVQALQGAHRQTTQRHGITLSLLCTSGACRPAVPCMQHIQCICL